MSDYIPGYQVAPSSDVQDHEIAHAMATFGGSFAKAISRAFLVADDDNRARMRAAYPELFAEYKGVVQHLAARAEKAKA